ncbi:Mossy fiber terminal-associated vertebrate-specific presynaptic protein [Penaeus vannamei]|uniref:Mossy fiber terminal-associated vertebrate-specific presynaptic protein n=1 Tax=Penaeus vannamei TaxID=6689 RepID=A0A423T713_PENVA|nr:Mossy fiber terminal-associated vertebrate-specific presynaptic protein [Penaeus vannamei]
MHVGQCKTVAQRANMINNTVVEISRQLRTKEARIKIKRDFTSKTFPCRYAEERTRPLLRQAISDPDVVTPPTPDQANNFYCSQGLSRSFYQQPPIGRPRRASWHADTGTEPGIREFFSVRVGALEQAVEECRLLTDPETDGGIKGAWLLTEINHWDIEKERVVILCDLSLLVVKYDFIALRHLEFNRIYLSSLENIQIGELTYPDHSLVPCLLSRIQNTIATLSSRASGAASVVEKEEPMPDRQFSLSTVSFEPRGRNMQGLRVTWNSGHEISFAQKWNPWSRDIPYTTFTSHPLYWYTGCENSTYDVKSLAKELKMTVEELQDRPDTVATCTVNQSPIVIENYVGIASLLHNATELGFFKLRGKVLRVAA